MTETELYKELGALTRRRDQWEAKIPFVASLLCSGSVRIQAKALWLLGEMGFKYPDSAREYVSDAAVFLDSAEPLLRCRAVNALGRIGRAGYPAVAPYWSRLFRFAEDEHPEVRHSFLWASENIAANHPDLYSDSMDVFSRLLYDPNDKVRMEAPEMFRVVGKRRPEFVRPYIGQLKSIAETDNNSVVRIHCLGAIRAADLMAEKPGIGEERA